MVLGRTDRRNDTLAYTRKHGILTGTTYKAFDVGTHGNTGNGNELDTILCHSRNVWSIYNLWVNRHLHGLEHVTACKVDGSRHLERQLDVCL